MSETDKILDDIRTYLRITAAAASRTVAKTTIDTLEKAQVYEKLAEGKSQRKIEEETRIPQTTISSWVGKFIEAGLVSSQGKPLFTLRELGINITELGTRKRKQQATTDTKKTAGSEPSSTASIKGGSTE
jgi:uncharacterized protein YerC